MSERQPVSDRLPSRLLRRYYEGQRHLRHGICLLNAGLFERAISAFVAAAEANPSSASLPRYLAACWLASGRPGRAAEALAQVIEGAPNDAAARIQQALAMWNDGCRQDAVTALRDAVRLHPESAEIHFQLGTLLASAGETTEAELRFTQSIAIDGDHADALVSLAMCYGVRKCPVDAVRLLERAQRRRPHDAHIALLLSQAARCLQQKGREHPVRAVPPPDDVWGDEQAITELGALIEAEPEFVDAFLSLPPEQIEEECFAALAQILERAVERRPQVADLRYHCGRVLERLGRTEEAIVSTEHALALRPRYTNALIQLVQLYRQTDRHADAATRLEEAIRRGMAYADIYFLLGNLYRDRGETERARQAYREALRINQHYEAARSALQALVA